MPKEVEKVLAYVTRVIQSRFQVLVFEHQDIPAAGVQVPAGTVESNETFEDAVRRELREEAGIDLVATPRLLGRYEWLRKDRNELHLRNVFHFSADRTMDSEWLHEVSGSGEDGKMIFRFYWVDIEKAENMLEADQGRYLPLVK